MGLVDVDDPGTWPTPVRDVVSRFLADPASAQVWAAFEADPSLVDRLSGHELLAFHSTRLMSHEVIDVRRRGLRLLDEQFTGERIAAAVANGKPSRFARDYAEANNVFAIRNSANRVGQVWGVLGRGVFDHDAGGVEPFFQTWGGEAIRGGPADPPDELEGLGTPTIVAFKVRPSRCSGWHTSPSLSATFASTLVGEWAGADLCWTAPVPGSDIVDVWQPGHPEYDRHHLPRV